MSPLWGILGKNLELEPEIPLGIAFFTSQVVKSLMRVYCSEDDDHVCCALFL